MADAGFFKGTSCEQDARFADKKKKLLKSMTFNENLSKKIDMSKVRLNFIRPWIVKRITELLGFEDEVHPDPKEIQINITGFLNSKNARTFLSELWDLLFCAMNSPEGVPDALLGTPSVDETDFLLDEDRTYDPSKTKKQPVMVKKLINKGDVNSIKRSFDLAKTVKTESSTREDKPARKWSNSPPRQEKSPRSPSRSSHNHGDRRKDKSSHEKSRRKDRESHRSRSKSPNDKNKRDRNKHERSRREASIERRRSEKRIRDEKSKERDRRKHSKHSHRDDRKESVISSSTKSRHESVKRKSSRDLSPSKSKSHSKRKASKSLSSSGDSSSSTSPSSSSESSDESRKKVKTKAPIENTFSKTGKKIISSASSGTSDSDPDSDREQSNTRSNGHKKSSIKKKRSRKHSSTSSSSSSDSNSDTGSDPIGKETKKKKAHKIHQSPINEKKRHENHQDLIIKNSEDHVVVDDPSMGVDDENVLRERALAALLKSKKSE